jgi:uncharacterized protein YjaG (DUF416 family)
VSPGDLAQLFGGAGAGVVGVCIIIVTLFITGQITTKKQLDDAEVKYQQKVAECDEWKEAWRIERARGDANEATGRIVKDVMQSLRQVGKELK